MYNSTHVFMNHNTSYHTFEFWQTLVRISSSYSMLMSNFPELLFSETKAEMRNSHILRNEITTAIKFTRQLCQPAISINIFRQSLKTYLFNNYSDRLCFILQLHVLCFLRFHHHMRFRDSFCLSSMF